MKCQLLLVLCVAVAISYAQEFDEVYDSNPLLESELLAVQAVHEAQGCSYGCRPRIVRPPRDEPNVSTVIQPITGYRANVAVIVDYGTCSVTREGYYWYIKWGDGSSDSGYYDHLLQVQRVHQYADRCRSYRITVFYCSDYRSQATTQTTFPNCDRYSRVIDVSFDPQPHY